MKKFYIVYGLIVLLGIVLKILGVIGWGLATSPVWFPICVALSQSLILALTVDLGNHMKRRKEKKETPTCENCLYHQTQNILNEKECLGEQMKYDKSKGYCDMYAHR